MPVEIPITTGFRDGIEYGRAHEFALVIRYLELSLLRSGDYEALLQEAGQPITPANLDFMRQSHAAMKIATKTIIEALQNGEHTK